ncbi:esterase B1-like [Lutzomyia longipalpis]|uniref:esterase B1-like n=1 Tax=Lutzomyia longipalpis TaxID=7200 RepID=UPI002483E663|nr:esterase B1-like [Lutzomyia longipalpis]
MRESDSKIVIVQAPCGPIKGITEVSDFNYEYASFYEVPYGKPPLGPLRFKDPEPLEPWSGLFDATVGVQNTVEDQIINEDCLRLNIYTKNTRLEGNPHPVMVLIAGGQFVRIRNHKDYSGPNYLLQKDVILVTMRHRLGALGFLSSDDPAIGVPGNAGLKDQVLALRWIQENIADFGGDPENVTLFGFSAGACCIHYHLMSPLCKGLFHKAIMMSGSAFFARGLMPKLNWAIRLARKLGWEGEDSDEASAFEYLRKVDVKAMKSTEQTLLTDEEKFNGLESIYGPVIEAYKSRMCIIPKHPDEMIKNAWGHSIPLIIGGVQDEGLLFYKDVKENPKYWDNLNTNSSVLLPYNLTQEPFKRELYGNRLKLFYFGRDYATVVDKLDSYIKLIGDRNFWYGIYRAIIERLRNTDYDRRGPTWVYRFAYESPTMNKYRLADYARGFPGVSHADDILYIFSNNEGYGTPKEGTPEYVMMQLMVGIYTSFAINGDPNNDLLDAAMGKWEQISCSNPLFGCNIANPPEMMELPEKERVVFWDTLYKVSREQVIVPRDKEVWD